MKATGIVRRIDELGRLVIPKEIRRSLRIRESDPIEIYTDRDGEIILRKYARLRELADFAPTLVNALHGTFGHSAAITDTTAVIAAAGPEKKLLLSCALSERMQALQREKKVCRFDPSASVFEPPFDRSIALSQFLSVPILAAGDPVGSVLLLSPAASPRFAEPELQTLKTISLYLGKLLEE